MVINVSDMSEKNKKKTHLFSLDTKIPLHMALAYVLIIKDYCDWNVEQQ